MCGNEIQVFIGWSSKHGKLGDDNYISMAPDLNDLADSVDHLHLERIIGCAQRAIIYSSSYNYNTQYRLPIYP